MSIEKILEPKHIENEHFVDHNDNVTLISSDQVVVLPEGLFFINSHGTLTAARALYSTPHGIIARHQEEPLCKGCERELSKGVCFNPGCEYYKKHQ